MKFAEYANVVVKFGENDLLHRPEIVSAAFLIDTKVRNLKHKSYHFLDVDMLQLDEHDPNSICIFGTFVKNTNLRREQVLIGDKLVEDDAVLQSSPSSFFCLFLTYHRLAYLPQSSFAPTLSEFSSTLAYFIREAWDKDIKNKRRLEKENNSNLTLAKVLEQYPKPSVKVVQATAANSISDYIDKFEKIKQLRISIIERNSEFDIRSPLQEIQRRFNRANPNVTYLNAENHKDGLEPKAVKGLVTSATDGGYEEALIKGTGKNGEKISGDNSDFKLKTPFTAIVARGVIAAKSLFESFKGLISDGQIKTNFDDKQIQKNSRVAKDLLNEFRP
jgi:hypothetical protein